MSRTIKTDQPPLKMTVDRGRLSPVTAYDAERLDTYRVGATLNVFITHEKQRVDEKRWWAAINRAVKECKTPWQNSAQASEAIKLALGIVNLSKTVTGAFMAYPKSLTERDDAELAGDVRDLFDILYNITGVDPDEWQRHAAEIRDDPDEETASGSPVDDDAAGSGESDPLGAAADPISSQESGAEAGGHEADDNPAAALASEARDEASDPVIRNLKLECLDKFLALATDAALTVKERRENLEKVKEPWNVVLPGHLDFVKACLTTADKLAKGELQEAPARKYLEGLL